LRTVFDIAKKRERFKELEKEVQKPDFWQKEKAINISQELKKLREEIKEFEELEKEFEILKEIGDEKEIEEFEKRLKEKEFRVFLSGKYDKNNAILSIFAGAGGQDAQDWVTLLLRMYMRYCQKKGFKTQILSQSFGEGGGPEGRIGIKSVALEVKGNFAYGFLRKESGVHRLVRISPFSPKTLRHTSFALVEVIPQIPTKEIDLKIRSEDLQTDFYRASGPGGQYVNKRMTAVRITHLPTGIQASCQSERSQAQNREKAAEMLFSKIYQVLEEKKKKEISEIRGEKISASWGNQIRSYVLHPYKLVKDIRTGVETANPEQILDGDLDKFIEAEIKI
jgi:peptide chain release factor 2